MTNNNIYVTITIIALLCPCVVLGLAEYLIYLLFAHVDSSERTIQKMNATTRFLRMLKLTVDKIVIWISVTSLLFATLWIVTMFEISTG